MNLLVQKSWESAHSGNIKLLIIIKTENEMWGIIKIYLTAKNLEAWTAKEQQLNTPSSF